MFKIELSLIENEINVLKCTDREISGKNEIYPFN